tara:strand:- start:1838 stop:2020 length:183 start_codon:yes stop_codon:yes gene_type:complete
MGCLFSCFRDKQIYENLELSTSLIDNYTQTVEYSRDDNFEFDYYPDFFETVYRRRLYTGD